jgi:hypothetical protein
MLASLEPNPHWFGDPGSTVIYMLAVIYKFVQCKEGKLLGVFSNPQDFRALYYSHPALFY